MHYQTFAVSEHLSPFVKYFWAMDSNTVETDFKTFSAIPDGSPGIIMVRSEKEAFWMNGNQQLPNIFLYGQAIAPVIFSAASKFSAVGICFQPHALKSIFGIDADDLTNSCVDLTLVGKRKTNLQDQIMAAKTIYEQIKFLSDYLFEQFQANKRQPDAMTKYAVTQLTQSRGTVSLRDLQKNMSISERSLERRFKESVGVSPKFFSRIIRFQKSMTQFRNSDYSKLSDIAYDNEYADQSHFIRVFKEFTGLSPLEYKNRSNEVAENFPEVKD